MTALPTLPAVVGGTVGSSTWGQDVNTLVNWDTGGRDYCFVYQATPTSITTSITAIPLDTEVEDTANMHLSSNAYFTVQTAGVFDLRASISFGATTSGVDSVVITQNGTAVLREQNAFVNASHAVGCAGFIRCAVGDVIQLNAIGGVSNTLTGTTQAGTFMQLRWVRL